MGTKEPTLDLYAKDQLTDDWSEKTRDAYRRNDGTMVTVVCITYNQEDYIAEALESMVSQETDFKFKVLVGDDASGDSTPDIVRAYAERYPDIVIPILREENLGGVGTRNMIDLCNRATSPFIALCEGDDYWTNPHKLQIQLDYMMEHPEMRACFAETEIVAPEDWYFNDHYQPNGDGKRCIPSSLPDFKEDVESYNASQYIKLGPAHTSSMFFRWDYGLEIPEGFFHQDFGDHSIMMMQMGRGEVGYIPGDPMSVYRRSDVGVTMYESAVQHFLETRISWVKVLMNLREFFKERLGGYAVVAIDNRIKQEVYNYFKCLIKVDDIDRMARFMQEYPEATRISMISFLANFYDQKNMTARYTWNGYKLLARDEEFVPELEEFVRGNLEKRKERAREERRALAQETKEAEQRGREAYGRYSGTPKENDIWVFSGFRGRTYLDNAKYLYEYVVENHKDIRAYWLTESQEIFDKLKAKGYPVLMVGTDECIDIMSRAAIAVIDHYRVTDLPSEFGLNDRTKIVQLWHGVGFKSNIGLLEETTIEGLQYCTDILPQPDDSKETLEEKAKLYGWVAFKRELFEKYFMLVCPGQERVVNLAQPWHIPESAIFFAGHPRNIELYRQSPDPNHYKIMYAPTYRADGRHERAIIDGFISSLGEIQRTLETIDGHLELRLHPHTWRDYQDLIGYRIGPYSRISLNEEEDIYQTLGTFSQVITDYSSIAMDFALLGRPATFLCPDYSWYVENEAGFSIDFKEVIPGPFVESWEDALRQVVIYRENPDIDLAMRREKNTFFFDEKANGPDNSERIVQEIKRRLPGFFSRQLQQFAWRIRNRG